MTTETIHLTFGGSSAERTLKCPAWALLSKDLPAPPPSDAARLGTALHAIFEAVLTDETIDPVCYVDSDVENVRITLSHIQEKIDPAIDAANALMDEHGIVDIWCELFAQLPGHDDVGGTADLVGLSDDGKTLLVADYKSGDGHLVAAPDNAQLFFYAMCILHSEAFQPYVSECQTVVLAIIQPTSRRESVVSQQKVPVDAVRVEFYQTFSAALKAQDVTTPHPGEHCTFCPAHAVCPAKQQLVTTAQSLDLDRIGDDLGYALDIATDLQKWLKAVQKMAYERLNAGEPVRGWKLIEKSARRSWVDETTVADHIKKMRSVSIQDAQTTKLKSPAQIEKLFAAKGVDFSELTPYVQKQSSGTTLARSDDPREAALTEREGLNVLAKLKLEN